MAYNDSRNENNYTSIITCVDLLQAQIQISNLISFRL